MLTLSLTAWDDLEDDDGESVLISLDTSRLPESFTAIAPTQATVTIIDNDDPRDVALPVLESTPAAYWLRSNGTSYGDNFKEVSSCNANHRFRLIWNTDMDKPDRWELHVDGGTMGSYSVTEDDGRYTLNGTARMTQEGRLSIRLRGRWDGTAGGWSKRTVSLICQES